VDKIIENPEVITNEKYRKKVVDNMKALKLSYELVTLIDNISLPLENVESLAVRPVNKEVCQELFEEYNFNSLMNHPLFV
jgi:5'-3' exonuclease